MYVVPRISQEHEHYKEYLEGWLASRPTTFVQFSRIRKYETSLAHAKILMVIQTPESNVPYSSSVHILSVNHGKLQNRLGFLPQRSEHNLQWWKCYFFERILQFLIDKSSKISESTLDIITRNSHHVHNDDSLKFNQITGIQYLCRLGNSRLNAIEWYSQSFINVRKDWDGSNWLQCHRNAKQQAYRDSDSIGNPREARDNDFITRTNLKPYWWHAARLNVTN